MAKVSMNCLVLELKGRFESNYHFMKSKEMKKSIEMKKSKEMTKSKEMKKSKKMRFHDIVFAFYQNTKRL